MPYAQAHAAELWEHYVRLRLTYQVWCKTLGERQSNVDVMSHQCDERTCRNVAVSEDVLQSQRFVCQETGRYHICGKQFCDRAVGRNKQWMCDILRVAFPPEMCVYQNDLMRHSVIATDEHNEPILQAARFQPREFLDIHAAQLRVDYADTLPTNYPRQSAIATLQARCTSKRAATARTKGWVQSADEQDVENVRRLWMNTDLAESTNNNNNNNNHTKTSISSSSSSSSSAKYLPIDKFQASARVVANAVCDTRWSPTKRPALPAPIHVTTNTLATGSTPSNGHTQNGNAPVVSAYASSPLLGYGEPETKRRRTAAGRPPGRKSQQQQQQQQQQSHLGATASPLVSRNYTTTSHSKSPPIPNNKLPLASPTSSPSWVLPSPTATLDDALANLMGHSDASMSPLPSPSPPPPPPLPLPSPTPTSHSSPRLMSTAQTNPPTLTFPLQASPLASSPTDSPTALPMESANEANESSDEELAVLPVRHKQRGRPPGSGTKRALNLPPAWTMPQMDTTTPSHIYAMEVLHRLVALATNGKRARARTQSLLFFDKRRLLVSAQELEALVTLSSQAWKSWCAVRDIVYNKPGVPSLIPECSVHTLDVHCLLWLLSSITPDGPDYHWLGVPTPLHPILKNVVPSRKELNSLQLHMPRIRQAIRFLQALSLHVPQDQANATTAAENDI